MCSGNRGAEYVTHRVPGTDRPLVAEEGAPEVEHRADALPDARGDRRPDLRHEQRGVLVDRGDNLAGLGVRREPRREDTPRRETAHDSGAADDHVNEADEVVADVVERVAAGRPGDRPWPRRSTANASKCSASRGIAASYPHQDSVWPGMSRRAGDPASPAVT